MAAVAVRQIGVGVRQGEVAGVSGARPVRCVKRRRKSRSRKLMRIVIPIFMELFLSWLLKTAPGTAKREVSPLRTQSSPPVFTLSSPPSKSTLNSQTPISAPF